MTYHQNTAEAAPTLKRAKTEITREKILVAAARVFQEKGYRHTRLTDIARSVGIHAGGIYYHYDSRETLVEAVLNESTRRVSELVTASIVGMPENASVKDRLRSAIHAHLSFVHRGDVFVLAYFRIIDQVSPEIRSRHDLIEKQYGIQWQKLIVEGQQSGELVRDFDATVCRMLLLGALQYTLEWYKSGGRLEIETLAEQAARLFLNGCAVPGKP